MKTRMKRRYLIHATKIRFRKPRQRDPHGKQEPIVLERSARLNLGSERGDKGDGVDGGDRDDKAGGREREGEGGIVR